VTERQYPPFGYVPSLVAGDRELRVNGRALGLLSGFFALPTGLFVHLWTATSDPELSGATYAFQRLDSAPATADLKVIARIDDSTDIMPANLVSGGGGQDETGADARTFLLWFPLDVTEVRDSVRVTVSWQPAGWEASLRLPADVLSAAAARSGQLPGAGE
jgi:hypothetical protein